MTANDDQLRRADRAPDGPDDPGVHLLQIRLRGGFWARADAFGVSAALRHYGWEDYARQVEDQIPGPVEPSGTGGAS